jgi:hypothetical protein
MLPCISKRFPIATRRRPSCCARAIVRTAESRSVPCSTFPTGRRTADRCLIVLWQRAMLSFKRDHRRRSLSAVAAHQEAPRHSGKVSRRHRPNGHRAGRQHPKSGTRVERPAFDRENANGERSLSFRQSLSAHSRATPLGTEQGAAETDEARQLADRHAPAERLEKKRAYQRALHSFLRALHRAEAKTMLARLWGHARTQLVSLPVQPPRPPGPSELGDDLQARMARLFQLAQIGAVGAPRLRATRRLVSLMPRRQQGANPIGRARVAPDFANARRWVRPRE